MTAPTHVYLTAHGSFNTGPWVGEGAQFGLRLPLADADAMPARGEIFTPIGNGDAVSDQGSTAGTHGTLTRTFTFRKGPVGSAYNWDAAFQVDAAEDLWTFLDAIKGLLRSSFRWTHIKQSPVDATGHAILNSSVYTLTTPLAGTATGMLPPQCAMAVSFRAPIIGRRGRGRIYIPAIATTAVDTEGMIGGTAATTLRTSFKTLVNSLEESPGVDGIAPVVAAMSADSATAVRPTQVRTGNRIDTIRSRREQVAETYTGLDL